MSYMYTLGNLLRDSLGKPETEEREKQERGSEASNDYFPNDTKMSQRSWTDVETKETPRSLDSFPKMSTLFNPSAHSAC